MSERRSVAVSLIACALLAGCGSSGGASTGSMSPTPPPGATGDDDGGTAQPDGDASSVEGVESGDAAGDHSCAFVEATAGATTKWAQLGPGGVLTYATLPTGERLLDFSGAGYMGGGVALPSVPVAKTVSPSGADDTAAIQAAIDAVSALPATNGIRGAVLLSAGAFQLAGSLKVSASGVVLRGSGSGANGTVITITGSPRMVLTVAGAGSWQAGKSTLVTDAHVPSGARSFHVASAAGLHVGDDVLVGRPVTAAWVHFMGMDAMVRNGKPETWLAVGDVANEDRSVSAISGDEVTLDMPITDTFDAAYVSPPGVTVAAYTFAGRIEQIGVESMHLVAPKQTVPIDQPIFGALQLTAVRNAWVRDVVADEFTTGMVVDGTAKWVTIEDSTVQRTAPIDGSAGYPFAYSVDGQGILVQRCTAAGDHIFSYATQDRANGPNVVLNFTAKGSSINLQPHQRWATGLLVDNATTASGGAALMNRGWDGSGHGWAIGFGVLWNGGADSLLVQQPPGAMNWAIGFAGTIQSAAAPGSPAGSPPLPQGIIDSPGARVTPGSLYLAQLCERLGPAAVHAIGY